MYFFEVLFLAMAFASGGSVKISSDGGYSIVVALEPNTLDPFNSTADYIYAICDTLELFSKELLQATEGVFYLKHVDLLVPNDWSLSASESTIPSYETADIRLNPSTHTPFVENVNSCGLPGSYIELPTHFLNTSMTTVFGDPNKVLLNLWAKFRYGVWDEHGEAGSENFPYFHKPFGAESWEATGCSNSKLEGIYTDLKGNSCSTDDGSKPTDECRFRPSNNNIANSSLMTYQWLDSVIQYCNKRNHNAASPNPQNLYCNHQSILSVIQNSVDYSSVTEKVIKLPELEMNVVKKRQLPSLLILLDTGSFTQNNDAQIIIPEAIQFLVEFLENFDLMDLSITVAVFSDDNWMQTKISWLTLNNHQDQIFDSLRNTEFNGKPNTNFGIPLMQAITEIEKLHSGYQSALLVLKTGRYSPFPSSIMEEEILLALRRNFISLFVVELVNTAEEVPRHFQWLSSQTARGVHVSLKNQHNVAVTMQPLLDRLHLFLRTVTKGGPKEITLFKGKVQPWTTIQFPFRIGMERDLSIHLTVNYELHNKLQLFWTQGKGHQLSRVSWDEIESNAPKKMVYTVIPILDPFVQISTFKFEYICDEEYLCGDEELLITTSDDVIFHRIVTSVQVNAVNNLVDFAKINPFALAPFVIYAKIEQRNNPVKNMFVEARLHPQNKSETTTSVLLEDNGLGSPDLFKNDGIYSGIFIPITDGTYKLTVNLLYQKKDTTNNTIHATNYRSVGKLLPVDQVPLEDKELVDLDVSYVSLIDYPGEIVFKNVARFRNKLGNPFKILDLSAQFTELGKETDIRFKFRSPKLLRGDGKVTKYILQGSKSMEGFLLGTNDDIQIVHEINSVNNPGDPEEFVIPTPPEIVYFRVLAVNGDLEHSSASNIVSPMPGVDELPEPTTDQIVTTTLQLTSTKSDANIHYPVVCLVYTLLRWLICACSS